MHARKESPVIPSPTLHLAPLAVSTAAPALTLETPASHPRLRYVAAVFAGWTAWALFWVTEQFSMTDVVFHADQAAEWFSTAYRWAFYTFAIFWLARRFPLERGRWLVSVPVHAAAALAVAVVEGAITWWGSDGARTLPASIDAGFELSVGWYGYMLGLGFALHYRRQARERERLTARLALLAAGLEGDVARAQWDAARMRMQPPFLFGTLDAIAALAPREPELADELTVRLADLLRRTVDQFGVDEVPLEVEIASLDAYLAVQEIRLAGRVEATVEAAPDALRSLLPGFVLQPLVEALLRANAASSGAVQRIRVDARREGWRLVLDLADVGRPASEALSAELEDVRARLRQLYGPEASLAPATAADGSPALRLTLPFREDDGDGAESVGFAVRYAGEEGG